MMCGLREEPIVDILNHFVPQCAPDSIIIPNEIVVGLAAYKVGANNQADDLLSNETVLRAFETIDPQGVTEMCWKPGNRLERITLELDLTGEKSGIYSFALYSKVLFGELTNTLDIGESDITHPMLVFSAKSQSLAFVVGVASDYDKKKVQIEYRPGATSFERLEVLNH